MTKSRWFSYGRLSQKALKAAKSAGALDQFPSAEKIAREMKQRGTLPEQKALQIILADIEVLSPRKRTQSQELAYLNLVRGTLNLWAIGKAVESVAWQTFHDERLRAVNPKKKDPRVDRLFPLAMAVYSMHNERAQQYQRALARAKGHGWKVELDAKLVSTISYTEALGLANIGIRGHYIIPEDEFKLHEIELQNAFKQWRSRLARN